MNTENNMTGIGDKAIAETTSKKTAYTHKFATPFTYGDKTFSQLTFDFDKLTTRDCLAIEREIIDTTGKVLVAPEYSGEFLIRMAARACNEPVGIDYLSALPMNDYFKIRNKARSFLMRAEL